MHSSSWTRKYGDHLPLTMWAPLAVFYIVGFAGFLDPSFEITAMALINSGEHWSPKESEAIFIERLEAILWLIGFLAFLIGRSREPDKSRRKWLLSFCLLCFLAFGEETSWGQHYFSYATPESIGRLNIQNEFNVHNTDLSALLGVSPEHYLYPYLGNLTHYLNPIFYILCMFIWGVLPLLTHFVPTKMGFVAAYPRYYGGCYLLLWSFAALYLITDNLFFDAGELAELTFASAGCCLGIYSAAGRRFSAS
jgi:hypothetical protein